MRSLVRAIGFIVAIILLSAFFGLSGALILLVVPSPAFARRWQKLWGKLVVAAAGVRLEIEGTDQIDPSQTYLFISNHLSNLDIPVLFVAVPQGVAFVAKKVLFYIPLFGWYLKAAGFVGINRRDLSQAKASLGLAATAARRGRSIVIFAEGTRSSDGSLQVFKKGPFHVALGSGVPIVPVSISGSFAVLPKGAWQIRPQPITVVFGKPIPIAPYLPDRREALSQAVREQIVSGIRRWQSEGT